MPQIPGFGVRVDLDLLPNSAEQDVGSPSVWLPVPIWLQAKPTANGLMSPMSADKVTSSCRGHALQAAPLVVVVAVMCSEVWDLTGWGPSSTTASTGWVCGASRRNLGCASVRFCCQGRGKALQALQGFATSLTAEANRRAGARAGN